MSIKCTIKTLAALLPFFAAAAAPPPTIRYTVAVSVSPRATARLTAAKSHILVAPEYFGKATPAHEDDEDNFGIELDDGKTRLAVPPQGGSVTITGQGLMSARLSWVKPGTLLAGAQVFSSGPRNAVSCTPAIDPTPLRQLNGTTLAVRCKLIGE